MTDTFGWREAIVQLQEQSRRAYLNVDLDTLERLWSPWLAVNTPGGRVLDRATVFELLHRGLIRHVSYDEEIEYISIQADVAIVMGRDTVVNIAAGPEILRRFTNIWRQDDGTWQLVARHASVVASPPSPSAVPALRPVA